MRGKSDVVGGLQVFAVAGTNVVSFGIKAKPGSLDGVLGFSIRRLDHQRNRREWVKGFKVFRSVIPDPEPTTMVSTRKHPVQALVWDDFYVVPGGKYDYEFYPFKGTPQKPDLTTAPVTISVSTEPLSGGSHDIFFNRGVTGSQSYAIRFKNLPPEEQPTAAKRQQAYDWLSRNLDEALIGFINSAKKGDAIRGCFYEFSFAPVLTAFKDAIDRGVDVKLIVDQKVNEHVIKANPQKGRPKDVFVESIPRVKNLAAIAAAGLPDDAIVAREARKDDIQHNKFMVLLKGKTKRTPTAVWTGSTNLTRGGIYGQANVGHHVRNAATAGRFFEYWKMLEDDPGAATDAKKDPANIAFLKSVDTLTPTPRSIDEIPRGVTPIFSPRGNTEPLDLYVNLLANPTAMSCGTFPFGITRTWRQPLADSGASGRLCFLLLDKIDRVKPTKADPAVILLNSKSNIYKAFGSELATPLGKWVRETNNIKLKLNQWVSYIHLKFILHDPLGKDPIVLTGSANFSDASTRENDENMIIVRGDRRVADIYFTEFNRLWGHYYYRSVVEQTEQVMQATKALAASEKPHSYQDLCETTEWQQAYAPGTLRSKRVQQYIKMKV